MHNFITDFDVLLAIFGVLVLLMLLFGVWLLMRDRNDINDIDEHEMLWRILDKGDK